MPKMTTVGPFVRFRDIGPASLPPHPDLAAVQGASTSSAPIDPPPALETFIANILNEANGFMSTHIQTQSVTKTESKSASPSNAGVKLSQCVIPASQMPPAATLPVSKSALEDETWHIRTSIHKNSTEKGTASWDELRYALLVNHSPKEMAYTPEIFNANCVLTWPATSSPHSGTGDDADHATSTESRIQVPGWQDVEMGIYEMAHELPFPMTHRCFTVLVVGGRRAGPANVATKAAQQIPNPHNAEDEFVIVQLPVDLTGVQKSLYASGRHKTDGADAKQRKDVVFGRYVSIEQCELINGGKETRWEMATANDAGGAIPGAVQKLAVPGAIAKDVGFVVDYTQKRRHGKT